MVSPRKSILDTTEQRGILFHVPLPSRWIYPRGKNFIASNLHLWIICRKISWRTRSRSSDALSRQWRCVFWCSSSFLWSASEAILAMMKLRALKTTGPIKQTSGCVPKTRQTGYAFGLSPRSRWFAPTFRLPFPRPETVWPSPHSRTRHFASIFFSYFSLSECIEISAIQRDWRLFSHSRWISQSKNMDLCTLFIRSQIPFWCFLVEWSATESVCGYLL
jgi:hypothetical protein